MTSPATRNAIFAFDPTANVNALIQVALNACVPSNSGGGGNTGGGGTTVTFDPTALYTVGASGLYVPRSYNERVNDRPYLTEFGALLSARYASLAALDRLGAAERRTEPAGKTSS